MMVKRTRRVHLKRRQSLTHHNGHSLFPEGEIVDGQNDVQVNRRASCSELSDADLAYRLRSMAIASRAVVEKFVDEHSTEGPMLKELDCVPVVLDDVIEMIEEVINRAERVELEEMREESADESVRQVA